MGSRLFESPISILPEKVIDSAYQETLLCWSGFQDWTSMHFSRTIARCMLAAAIYFVLEGKEYPNGWQGQQEAIFMLKDVRICCESQDEMIYLAGFRRSLRILTADTWGLDQSIWK